MRKNNGRAFLVCVYVFYFNVFVYKTVSGHDTLSYSELHVPFPCEQHAEVAYNTLRVDQEPPRSEVNKCLLRDKNMLIV